MLATVFFFYYYLGGRRVCWGMAKWRLHQLFSLKLFLLQIFLIQGPFLIFRLEESSADEPVAQAF